MSDIVKQIREWQELAAKHKPPESQITQIRISKVMPTSGKVFIVGAHAYISEGDFQSMVAERSSPHGGSDLLFATGIPVLREWPAEQFCPKCNWNEFYIKNYSPNFQDGDLCCKKCGHKLRDWDAG